MKVAVLSKNRKSYFINKLENAVKELGAEFCDVEILDLSKFKLNIDSKKYSVVYDNEVLKPYSAFLPMVYPVFSGFAVTVLKHLEYTGANLLNTAEAMISCYDKFFMIQKLQKIDGVNVPNTSVIHSSQCYKKEIADKNEFPIVLKTSTPFNKGFDSMFIDSINEAETFWDLNFLLNKLIKPELADQNIILQEFVKESQGVALNYVVLKGKIVDSYASQDYLLNNKCFESLKDINCNMGLNEEEETLVLEVAKDFKLGFGVVSLMESNRGKLFFDVNPMPDYEAIEKNYGIDLVSKLAREILFKN